MGLKGRLWVPALVFSCALISISACSQGGGEKELNLAETLSLDVSWNLFIVFAAAAVTVLLAILWPDHLGAIGAAITDNPVHTGGLGLLGLGLALPVLVTAAVTLIGIPLSLAGIVVLAGALSLGWAGLSFELGRRLESLAGEAWAPGFTAGIGALALGVVLAAAGQIPCVGRALQVGVLSVGLGAVVVTRFGTRTGPASGKLMEAEHTDRTEGV